MAIKDAIAAHFRQIDNRIQNISFVKGVEILSSKEAWRKYSWVRKYFSQKPRGGYFVWVKKSTSNPLYICLSLSKKHSRQNLTNLLIVGRNVKVKVNTICNALHSNLYGEHLAKGKIILLSGAQLEYQHQHYWGKHDVVTPDYQFILEKESYLFYRYQNQSTPERLDIKTEFYLHREAIAQSELIIQSKNSQINIAENLYLQGRESRGNIKLKVVGQRGSKISAHTCIRADAPSKGHLDCQGLVVDKDTHISLIPKLFCRHKEALLTHEASLGKIKEEQLFYLRSRGLTKKEALNLIINGFLNK